MRLEPAPVGLRVAEVTPGSPAASAGLQNGDVIVQARGGEPGSVQMFTLSVRAAGGGTVYPLIVLRGTQRITLQATLGRTGMAVGAPPPALNAQVVMGNGPGDLTQLRGRVVVLDFWASWCGPCRMVMPALNRLHQRFAAQGLTVLGVSNEPPAVARTVGTAMQIGYTLATDPSAQARYGVTSIPTMVVLDRAGTVRRISVGVDSGELHALDTLVQRLLAEPARP